MRLRVLVLACFFAVAFAPAGAARAGTLVALGDSYSSGEGAPPFDAGTDEPGVNTCHRSPQAWPLLVAGAIGMNVLSVACSGARISDVRDQVVRLAATPDVAVVTVTVGGNDAGFAKVLRTCALHVRCDRRYRGDGDDRLADEIAFVAARLTGLYADVREAAPGARIVVADYPRLFPARPRRSLCVALGLIGPAEQRFLNEETDFLDEAIGRVASAAGVDVADVAGAFEGHELRCGGGREVNALSFGPLGISASSFHPNARGQRALADAVLASTALAPDGAGLER